MRALRRVAVAAPCIATVAHAAEPVTLDVGPDYSLTVSAQVRPRFTLHSGLDFRGAASEWRENVSQRSRFGVELESRAGVGIAVQLQDVRVWGEETDPANDFQAKGFDVHQAFAKIPFLDELELRIGRQELRLDDERLVGNLDFSQRARAFDAARLAWTSRDERYTAEAFYAKVREPGTSPDGHVAPNVQGDVDLAGAHAALELAPGHFFAPLYLVRLVHAPGDVRHTLGFHLNGEGRGFSYRVESYYQYGTTGDRAIHAYLVAGRAGYTLDVPEHPGLFGFAEVLSGDGSPEGAFDTLYPSSHRHNGAMEIFGALPAATRDLGLVDVGGRLESGVVPGIGASLTGHWFRTASPAPDASRLLGGELDVEVAWEAIEHVSFEALYGAFLPGAAMGAAKGYPGGTSLHPESLAYVTANVEF